MSQPLVHIEPTVVQLPTEPCVVLSDGVDVLVATDRTHHGVMQWADDLGPISRAVFVARLRALADCIDREAGGA